MTVNFFNKFRYRCWLLLRRLRSALYRRLLPSAYNEGWMHGYGIGKKDAEDMADAMEETRWQ